MKHQYLTFIFLLLTLNSVFAQTKFQSKADVSYLAYRYRTVTVDAGPNWKGYNLDDKQNGVQIASINGLSFLGQKLFAGIGVGYLNFQGINGVSTFAEVEYIPLKKKFSPLAGIRAGYSNIWTQAKESKGSALLDLNLGINFSVNNKHSLYFKSGIAAIQQALFTNFNLGYRFN